MKNIRIGKDIAIKWEIKIDGEIVDLSDKDITITMTTPKGEIVELVNYSINYNVISFGLNGTAFKQLGLYSLTCWLNKGKEGQTMVDEPNLFKLVKTTIEEL